MSRRPWFAFYFADFVGDTLHLTAAQGWGYLHLIGHYYQHGRLPSDEEQLARIARMSREQWASDRPIIQAFFQDGWRHRRIDTELTNLESVIERGRKGGVASAKTRRPPRNPQPGKDCGEANGQANVKQTAKQTAKQTPSKPQAPHLHPQPQYSEASASEPNGSQARPVYTDSRHQLWAEGVEILTALGVKAKSARPLIGRWLKDTADDAQHVLDAIQRARDGRVIEPIAWITRALKHKANGSRHAQEDRRSVHAGAHRLVDSIRALNADLARTGGDKG